MKDGFIKVAAATPAIRVADCEYNKANILALIKSAAEQNVKLLVFPELCITGYTCADLFMQDTLLTAAQNALRSLLAATSETDILFAVGLPVGHQGKLFNCAAICCRGELLALVPKRNIPNYGEFYESRWFAACPEAGEMKSFAGCETYFGADVVFPCQTIDGLSLGVEICEDLWAPVPPSSTLAAEGAALIFNLSASDELACKARYRESLVVGQSARLICGYIFSSAGSGESTTDMVFSGHDMIAENGILLNSSRFETGLVISEIDVDRLCFERRRLNSFESSCSYKKLPFTLNMKDTELSRFISPTPFVPEDSSTRSERCDEIFTIAAMGLKKRMEHTCSKQLVVGVSGGLDSTLAMLISAKALDLLSLPRANLIAVTMPGFGTTARTKGNAERLAEELGATLRTVSIAAAVRQHFADIGHDEADHSVVYENAQARERTQVLMDIANGSGALVVGTGDMSELALGWATYNGDHMSMYGVNAGIPKTLVRHLVAFCADTAESSALSVVLRDILATPVSPELLPAENGDISQKTEELVGPYELHDFFLYYLVRWGCEPQKVFRLAKYAFNGEYDDKTILHWLKTFVRRFFSQQYKRSCLPDGPKVGTLSLSPRGDWRMPSDAVADIWLKQLDSL